MSYSIENESHIEYGLLGRHLSHSHSPAIHALLGDYSYQLVEKEPEDVLEFLNSHSYKGLNVTIPYKQHAASVADIKSPIVERLHNANTLVRKPNGLLYAENTDYFGFKTLLSLVDVDVLNKHCVILGDGAAATTCHYVLEDLGASHITHISRTRGLTYEALREASLPKARDVLHNAALLVNATPHGMYPHTDDELLVDLGQFGTLEGVVDLIYNPLKTRLIQAACDLGIPCMGGLAMLVAQAKHARDLFCDVHDDDSCIETVLSCMYARLRTIALIGMPGAGKTSVGRRLARKLSLEFIDTDGLVHQNEGKTCARIIQESGESAFRDIESAAVQEAFASGGRIIACGGGVVTKDRNRHYLRQNGPVILLSRGLEEDSDELSTKGRPLSQSKGTHVLREERAPLYHSWADLEVASHPSGPLGVAEELASYLNEHPSFIGS